MISIGIPILFSQTHFYSIVFADNKGMSVLDTRVCVVSQEPSNGIYSPLGEWVNHDNFVSLMRKGEQYSAIDYSPSYDLPITFKHLFKKALDNNNYGITIDNDDIIIKNVMSGIDVYTHVPRGALFES